jgi:multiple sugar transport system ATP-binding protein
MRTEIKKLHARVGKTTIYVTHDQVEAMTLASRIAVMNKGVLQQFASPREVYERPANVFVAGFMGSPTMNFLPAVAGATETGAPALSVQADGGPAILPLAEDAPRLGPGQKVVLGVRPEHFSVSHRARGDLAAVLPATVEVVEPAGAETMVVLRAGGQEIVARYEPEDAPQPGAPASLVVDMRRVSLFDPATERRL